MAWSQFEELLLLGSSLVKDGITLHGLELLSAMALRQPHARTTAALGDLARRSWRFSNPASALLLLCFWFLEQLETGEG